MRPISLLSDADLDTWGNEDLEVLIQAFGNAKTHKWKDEGGEEISAHAEPIISPEETRQEWQSVKRVVITQRYPRDRMADLWSLIYQYHADQFPNLIKLAQLSLTCPVHTAGCERGFSKQNLILSSLHYRLLPETQDKLCRVAIEGPPRNEFLFVEALTVWRSEKKRFIFCSSSSSHDEHEPAPTTNTISDDYQNDRDWCW